MQECKFEGCDKHNLPRLIKGYCDMHYKRIQRHGDPSKVATSITMTNDMMHGMHMTPTYYSWQSMKSRCRNPKNASYYRYGAKGIEVYEEWYKSFAIFLKDMGIKPEGTSLDRIDSNGNYEPGNCRWATFKEQARNSGRRKLVRG